MFSNRLPIASTFAMILMLAQAAHSQPASVRQHLDAARKLAGTQWAQAFNYFCAETQTPNAATDPEVEPRKVFDNLYFIGNAGTLTYAITTPDGIILIDAGYADKVESNLVAGLKKLGLDPAQVKLIIVTHGHADHFGGSAYFQQQFGSHVAASAADWNMMQPSGGAPRQGAAAPKRDVVAVEGQPLQLGSFAVTPVLIPGHTPGALGLIFPVKDGSQSHMAALFGGTILRATNASPEAQQQYLRSVQHFKEVARKMKVDVQVSNHPLFDGTFGKSAVLQVRKPGEPNPFVVGEDGYERFMDLTSECLEAAIARK